MSSNALGALPHLPQNAMAKAPGSCGRWWAAEPTPNGWRSRGRPWTRRSRGWRPGGRRGGRGDEDRQLLGRRRLPCPIPVWLASPSGRQTTVAGEASPRGGRRCSAAPAERTVVSTVRGRHWWSPHRARETGRLEGGAARDSPLDPGGATGPPTANVSRPTAIWRPRGGVGPDVPTRAGWRLRRGGPRTLAPLAEKTIQHKVRDKSTD